MRGDRIESVSEATAGSSVAFFLGLATMRVMLDVFLVTALVLRLVARSRIHVRSS